jgi:hypothetical protein
VLIRLRAVFTAPTAFAADREFGYLMQRAQGEVREASMVVLTPAGRRLVFASFTGGKARLLTAPSCNDDS